MFFIPDSYLERLIEEDLHIMDLTTLAAGIEPVTARVAGFPKRDCVVAGVEEAARIFELVGAKTEIFHSSGDSVPAGDVCLRVEGAAGRLHAVYKLAQNLMEYSSGIATRCNRIVRNARQVAPGIEVSVTRKHFPGVKRIALKAALAGGASIHRLGLSDSILVFEEHREFMGGLDGFLTRVPEMRQRFPEKKIAAEAETPEIALAFARAGVDTIQCERFSPDALKQCVKAIRETDPRIRVAAAGGVNNESAAIYAGTGVDILVTSWVYFGKPEDIKLQFSA